MFKDLKFLSSVEKIYKEEYLPDITKHAELLAYDYSNGGDTELLIEDIERINFDIESYELHGDKMKDWQYMIHERDWSEERMDYTHCSSDLFSLLYVANYDVPELLIAPEDQIAQNHLFEEMKGLKYAHGYDEELGDKDILFKTKEILTARELSHAPKYYGP